MEIVGEGDPSIDNSELSYEEAITPGLIKGGRRRKKIDPNFREQLLMEADYECEYCGARQENGATLEIDHIVPVSKGGTADYANLQVLCATCNRKKAANF